MIAPYHIEDTSEIFSPGLVFFKDLIKANIGRALEMAGDPKRLRPHVKTHKTREIVLMEKEMGITKHKCATLAEAEMLASCGVDDILLAYQMVGPNCQRMARLALAYPKCRFIVLADHPAAVRDLSRAMTREGAEVEVMLDVDVGFHRTGIAPGPDAIALYELIIRLPGLQPGGLQAYDGHHKQENLADRKEAVNQILDMVRPLRAKLVEEKRLPVPRVVLGGTPTFAIYAGLDWPGVECSPGTCFLHDQGYGTSFPDMAVFTAAAAVLTRVVSRPTPTRITFDLGTKSIASDPPAGKRCILLDVPDYQPIIHNEEHFVVETPAAEQFQPGDFVLAIPNHICPTCALHRQAYVIENGRLAGRWDITARDRVLNY